MKKSIAGALVASAVLSAPGAAQAYDGPARVPCWTDSGSPLWKVKPRKCHFNGGDIGAYVVTITKMRWTSWGGRTARGVGVIRENMGYRAPARFRLYHRGTDGGVPTYWRIRGVAGPGRAYGVSGRLEFVPGRFHFDRPTLGSSGV